MFGHTWSKILRMIQDKIRTNIFKDRLFFLQLPTVVKITIEPDWNWEESEKNDCRTWWHRKFTLSHTWMLRIRASDCVFCFIACTSSPWEAFPFAIRPTRNRKDSSKMCNECLLTKELIFSTGARRIVQHTTFCSRAVWEQHRIHDVVAWLHDSPIYKFPLGIHWHFGCYGHTNTPTYESTFFFQPPDRFSSIKAPILFAVNRKCAETSFLNIVGVSILNAHRILTEK